MIILILATDMARHAEILDSFKQKIDNFDYTSEDHINTLKMILIKVSYPHSGLNINDYIGPGL